MAGLSLVVWPDVYLVALTVVRLHNRCSWETLLAASWLPLGTNCALWVNTDVTVLLTNTAIRAVFATALTDSVFQELIPLAVDQALLRLRTGGAVALPAVCWLKNNGVKVIR
jgi:hypothetical protein